MAYCQSSGVCLTQFCLLTSTITRGWQRENIYQVQNKSAPWLINSKTQLPPNTSTHHLTTSSTHKLINSQTHKLITNPLTHQLINLQTQNLKLFVLFLQNHSEFHAVLAKI